MIIILASVLVSCEDETDCCTVIDTDITIKYVDEKGQNLFDTGVYNESAIEVYHKIDGKWERYRKGGLDHPKGILVYESEDGYYLRIFPNDLTDQDGLSETKIEFSEKDFDILKTAIDKSGGNSVVTKVWYNDQLKWEAYETDRKFEIVKNLN